MPSWYHLNTLRRHFKIPSFILRVHLDVTSISRGFKPGSAPIAVVELNSDLLQVNSDVTLAKPLFTSGLTSILLRSMSLFGFAYSVHVTLTSTPLRSPSSDSTSSSLRRQSALLEFTSVALRRYQKTKLNGH